MSTVNKVSISKRFGVNYWHKKITDFDQLYFDSMQQHVLTSEISSLVRDTRQCKLQWKLAYTNNYTSWSQVHSHISVKYHFNASLLSTVTSDVQHKTTVYDTNYPTYCCCHSSLDKYRISANETTDLVAHHHLHKNSKYNSPFVHYNNNPVYILNINLTRIT